jgi:hypothetical protein
VHPRGSALTKYDGGLPTCVPQCCAYVSGWPRITGQLIQPHLQLDTCRVQHRVLNKVLFGSHICNVIGNK